MKFSDHIDLHKINLPQDPIFIVGYPRSGTTLLQSLLATQENVYSMPETHFFTAISRSIKTNEKGYVEATCLSQIFKELSRVMNLEFSQNAANSVFQIAEVDDADHFSIYPPDALQHQPWHSQESDTFSAAYPLQGSVNYRHHRNRRQ